MKVLVVDDDEIFRALLREIISEAGYEVSAHANGQLAWEYLSVEGADMAVLDVNMPELDGLSLLRKIRTSERLRGMPVLLLTIKAFVEDQVAGYETGADDYLTKPFSAEVLAARLKTLERRILGRGTAP
ncbi:MAG: response regulator transcription factor [Elusimicrobia bacterium]|nr:response regulator transcription factor [Elusimicrobiota bacterium]